MIRVNGWTNYSERIGDEVYNVSEDGYKTYKIEVFLSSPFDSSTLPIRTITVGSLEQAEKILKKEREKAGITEPYSFSYATRDGSKC